jgi:TRAP transporter TAXI family solute receptor
MKKRGMFATEKVFALFLLATGLVVLFALTPVCAAPAHEKVTLTLMTSKFGSDDYVLGSAVEKIINKTQHPWLKIMAVEGIGGTDNVLSYEELSKEKRRTAIMNVGDAGYIAAVRGLKPWFKKPYANLRGAINFGTGEIFFASFDPKIKTFYDLAGRTLGGPAMGSSASVRLMEFIKAAGLTDKINVKWLGPEKSAEALQDGRIDAILVQAFGREVAPGFQSLWTKKDKIYIVTMPEEIFQKVRAAGWPLRSVKVPPKTFSPNQTGEVNVHRMLARAYFTGDEADADVIYEFIKVIYQNADKFKDYFNAPAMRPVKEEFGYLPVESEAEVHPGALKFYKEMKLRVGAP